MKAVDRFNGFVKENPNWKEQFNVVKRDSERFQRILCACKVDGVDHKYWATIDTQTGGIYLDCTRRKIFAKSVALAIVRPIHTVIKTIWHLTILLPMIESAVRNYRAYSKGATDENREELKSKLFYQFLTDNWHSFADIFRTPIYGFAMTMTYLAGVIAALFNPNALYYTRLAGGTLEYQLLRAENLWEDSFWELSPCFSPFRNITQNPQDVGFAQSWFNKNLEFLDEIASATEPEELDSIGNVSGGQWIKGHFSFDQLKSIASEFDEEEETGINDTRATINYFLIPSSLEKFARDQIEFRQKSCQFFNDYWQKLPKGLPYTTLGMGQIQVAA